MIFDCIFNIIHRRNKRAMLILRFCMVTGCTQQEATRLYNDCTRIAMRTPATVEEVCNRVYLAILSDKEPA